MAHSESHLVVVDEVAATLRRLSQDADSRLSAVGERLGGIVGVLDDLTRRFEALSCELEDETLHAPADRLRRIARDIVAMAQALVDEGSGLFRLARLNQQMGACIAQLRKTVRAIATLAVNAQIEAAHIDARSEDFSIFAKEIIRLAKTAEAMVEGYLREHETLTGVLRSACDAQAGFAQTHEETLRGVGQRLEASLAAIDARRRQAVVAAGQIGERSKRIGQEIGAAVMALQIGDITRQRIEHVSEALAMVAVGWGEGYPGAPPDAAWSATLSESEKIAIAATVCRIQSAQTVQAASEFEGEVRRVVASLTQLAEEAAGIVRLGTEAYGAAGRHGGSFLEELQENLKAAGTLLRESHAARDRVDSVVAAVAVSLGDLLDHLGSVRRIEVDMRLVGLNTALKCGRLGAKGRTLSVVAQELRGYASQTVQDVDALMAALREVAATAEGFDRDRRDHGADRIGAMERDMAASLGPFEACGERLSGALTMLSRQGSEVRRSLEETANGAETHEAIAKALTAAGNRLRTVMGGATADQEVDAALVRERLSFFSAGHYTMASERDIHAQFAQSTPIIAASSVPATTPDMSLDDILF